LKAAFLLLLFLPALYYSQAIQIERGWNLVSWNVVLPDMTTPPLKMDDIFREWLGGTTYGSYFWLNPTPSGGTSNDGDRVGRYDFPQSQLYPAYTPSSSWTWDIQNAYYLHIDPTYSSSHFWEYNERPSYDAASFNFTPTNNWNPHGANYWYFLGYPLRMQLDVVSSATIQALIGNTANPLIILKDDNGEQYDPYNESRTNLKYLKPGKGYFAGFNRAVSTTCLGFDSEQGAQPAMAPPSLPSQDPLVSIASGNGSHFTFNSRTQWWYAIVIDSVNLSGAIPESGDEIAVLDGNLCVGSAAYCDSFPVFLVAWEDDIATPDTVDGYTYGNDMTFIWYDKSQNQEITFVPPPTTQAVETEPDYPTHSGFGKGFCAVRSLTYGVAGVNQLPEAFKLGSNYPNPFNAETVIPLELPQRSRVKIELFNVRGQSMGVIYQGMQNAGWPKIGYKAAALASGVYFYRVSMEGLEHSARYSSTGKMLLLK
jgi:hypothetical protein